MFPKNLRMILTTWGITQEKMGKLTSSNKDKVNSYLRSTNPPVEFLLRIEELCNYEFTARELWYEDIDANRIPPAPVMNAKPRSETEEESKRYRLNRALRDIGDIVGDLIEED